MRTSSPHRPRGVALEESVDQLWQRAHSHLAAKQPELARATLESILVCDPHDTKARLFLCGLDASDDHPRKAAAQVIEAARNPPTEPRLLGDLIAALLWAGEIVLARRLLDSPVFASSQSIPVLMRAAAQRQVIGEHVAALELMERTRDAGADGRDFLFHHGVQLAFNGRMDDARSELERCIAIDPPLGRAFVQLARMQKQTPRSNHIGMIQTALRRINPGSVEHAALEFALHKELEDLERHEEAWQALERGNAIMHSLLPCDSAQEAALFDQLLEVSTKSLPDMAPAPPEVGPQPIFVLGMPRSGTTVLERMLGNHSRVAAAGELGDFPHALFLATDHVAPVMFDSRTLTRLADVDWQEVGRTYLAQSQWRAHGKPFYVDKLPRNWMVAGLITRALPEARILHVVRDPMDLCFSNWRNFLGPAAEYAYSYDLGALPSHHRQYRRVMAHWHKMAPGCIHDVEYSRLVREPENTMRTVLAFCGLEYEAACTDLARNTTPSATLSMSQVREPLRSGEFGRWRAYAPHVSGLLDALTRD